MTPDPDAARPTLAAWLFAALLLAGLPGLLALLWFAQPGALGARTALLAVGVATAGSTLLALLLLRRQVLEPLRRLAPADAAALGAAIPVRELAALQAALRQSHARADESQAAWRRECDALQALFDASPVALAMTTRHDATEVGVNPALADLLECAPGTHLWPALMGTDDASRGWWRDGVRLPWADYPLLRASRWGERVHEACLELRRPSGEHRLVEVRAVPLRTNEGRTSGAVAAFADVTDLRILERQRRQITHRERRARLEAQEANRGKDEFLAMLGHELRSPLGAISAAVEVLNRSQGDAAQSARRVIERQTRQMAQLMNDLQDVVGVAAGKVKLHRQPLDLAQLVWRPLDALRLAGRFSQHVLTIELAPAWVDGDPVRLEQVIVNLLTNAVKYTPAGGRIGLTVRPDGGEALLAVQDSGYGIPAQLMPHVFDLFVQGSGPAERRQGGMGLGLTLVRRIAELHGGQVAAESDGPDLGSRFSLRLPPSATPGAAADTPWAGRDAVVIDPSGLPPFQVESLLGSAGCRVAAATDGLMGLSAILSARPGLALIDGGLPGGTQALVRAVRAAGSPTRLVCMASTDDQADASAGFDAVLRRPLDLATLERIYLALPRAALAR